MKSLPWFVAALMGLGVDAVAQNERKESTYYYSDSYSPSYLIRRQPWQAIAVDSKGQVYVAHPYDYTAGNKQVPSGRRLQIFNPQGEPIAQYQAPNGVLTFGLAVDERKGRIYGAANMQHVLVFGWEGPGKPVTLLREANNSPTVLARKEGGRCVSVSLGRDGSLFTADLAENKVYRFYESGGYSSFGSGPGGGDQGFENIRRVFESPVDGSLFVLDAEGVRKYSPAGSFTKRIGKKVSDENWLLAMSADGTLLAGWGKELVLMDGEGATLKTLPIPPEKLLDAALGKDGRIYAIPRGEEYCYSAYDPKGTLIFQRGADFERLVVTLDKSRKVSAKIDVTNALKAGLLTGAEKKAAEARPQSPAISVFLKSPSTPAWRKLEWAGSGEVPLPADLKEDGTLRFTTAAAVDGAGPAVEFNLPANRR
jgi:hypothetical protein